MSASANDEPGGSSLNHRWGGKVSAGAVSGNICFGRAAMPDPLHWPLEIAGKKMEAYYRWMEAMVPVTMSGCPAANVPAGLSATGLPMGLQIMAPNHAERSCLEVAYAYDQVTRRLEKRPPPILAGAD